LNPIYFLGGRIKLNEKRAVAALKNRIADPLNISVEEAASGIYDIATSKMGDLIRSLTVEKGMIREICSICVWGRWGATRVTLWPGSAEDSNPTNGCCFFCYGVLTSDFMHTYQLGSLGRIPVDVEWFNGIFEQLENKAIDVSIRDGYKERDLDIQRFVDMRYARPV